MKAAAAVAEILKREGVEFLIGYPVNTIIEASAQADIRTIIVRQERTGLHMADAVSRVTSADRIGVFVMQHGPGTENAFGGVAQAFGDSVPILVMPGGYPRRIAGIAPNFNSTLNYRNVTKSAEYVMLADTIPDVMRRAFTQVRNGRPRPVLVEFPVDLWNEDVAEPLNYKPVLRTRSAPDPKAAAEVARVLVDAPRPVIYAGQGVHYAKAWPQLRQLAELLEAPVTTSLQARARFRRTTRSPSARAAVAISKQLHHFLTNADVIFGIGCSFTQTNYGVFHAEGQGHDPATSIPRPRQGHPDRYHGLTGTRAHAGRAHRRVKDRLKGNAARPARRRDQGDRDAQGRVDGQDGCPAHADLGAPVAGTA